MTTVENDTVDADASRPLRKDAARNRQLLLDAGRVVFAEHGLDATLDDIARHAGVGVGTAYRHFGNKQELAKAIFTEAVERILALGQTAMADDDPWRGIVDFIEGAASAQAVDRGLREVLAGAHDEDAAERLHDSLEAILSALLDRAKQAGTVRADAEVSDIGIVVLMLCTVADLGGEISPELWRRYLPMLLDGLRPGRELPVPPISEPELRAAMMSHKKRLRTDPGC